MFGNKLFDVEPFYSFEQNRMIIIKSKIGQISDDNLLLPDRSEMINSLVKQNEIEKIEIESDESKYIKEAKETVYSGYNNFYTKIIDNIPGLSITWKVSFLGDTNLFYVKPSTYLAISFNEIVSDGFLQLSLIVSLSQLEKDPNYGEEIFREKLKQIRTNIEYLNRDIESFNKKLKSFITDVINGREKKANIIKRAYDAMNIPIKKNENAPSIVPITRKLVRPELPSIKKEKTASISNEDYNHIIGVIRHVGATFEITRKTFFKLSEEELRDVILANLNGHYKGMAGGETFRGNGKTDINIEFENRSAFVGECKLWKGKETFEETICQLISYTTWRDSKNAIIIFNKKNKDFVSIQKQILELIHKVKGFQRVIPTNEGEWEFILKASETDDEKKIHVFVFDIFLKIELNKNSI